MLGVGRGLKVWKRRVSRPLGG